MRAASLIALALLACCLPAARAKACVYSMIEQQLGPPPTPEELAAEAKLRPANLLRQRSIEAERALRSGRVDAAAELADMLVPNVRPVWTLGSDCDGADPDNEDARRPSEEPWFAGTAYEGREQDFPRLVRDWAPEPVGAGCNAEVRGRFRDRLRRRLTARELGTAYVFLAARRPPSYSRRLAGFQGHTRRPPLYWYTLDSSHTLQLHRWLRLNPTGRSLKQAVDAFWSENGPLLGDDSLACPSAAAQYAVGRAELLRRVAAADGERRARTAPPR